MAFSSPCAVVLATATLLGGWLGGCKSEAIVRRDDVSVVAGEYERPKNGVYEIETAKLIVTKDGMTLEDAPYRESVRFAESACDTQSACKVTGVLCSATLEKQADGNLLVSAERRCQSMAGTWYTKENAKRVAEQLASSSRAPIASAAGTPRAAAPAALPAPGGAASGRAAPAASASPSASTFALLPDASEPSQDLTCVHRCNQVAVACAKACKSNDLGCLPRCNGPTLACAAGCSSK